MRLNRGGEEEEQISSQQVNAVTPFHGWDLAQSSGKNFTGLRSECISLNPWQKHSKCMFLALGKTLLF